jgi:glycosyltransferase involved in cell wall biosynthesis
MSREKGLEVMVEAFVHLRTVLGHPDARLHLAGAATAENEPLIEALQRRLAAAGLTDQVRWQSNISRDDKAAMLGALTLFSVPATYPEAFGLYVIEAMASGVPVVQPATAAFPEIVARAGAGVLVDCDGQGPPFPELLAQAWHELLQQPEELRAMAARSRRAAEEFYDVSVMRDRFLALARETLGSADNRVSLI